MIVLAAAGLCLLAWSNAGQAAPARALVLDDFRSATTDGIVRLCTAPESDPLYQAAAGYCVGYLTGAFHAERAIDGGRPTLVCFSSAEPSRREEIAKFVAWTTKHPEHGSELAVDTLFRYLAEAYPCK
jgi:hypothetical protein